MEVPRAGELSRRTLRQQKWALARGFRAAAKRRRPLRLKPSQAHSSRGAEGRSVKDVPESFVQDVMELDT
jgi:hypothetical protein